MTIGLPVFDGERFIDEAIGAIRRQTFTDWELIVADNASVDRTLDICAAHAAEDDRISVITSEVNHGAAWNFNRLVPLARGRYFKWAAHDDLIRPSLLERCVEKLERDCGSVLCSPSAVDIDVDGEVIRPIDRHHYGTLPDPVARVRAFLARNTSCVEIFGLIRLDALRSTHLIGPYTSSDRALLLELALMGSFCEVPEPLMLRRQHDSRSVRRDAQERSGWFDPASVGHRTMPRWRLLGHYVRSIWTAPLTLAQRSRTAPSVVRWTIRNRRALARELATRLRGRDLQVTDDPGPHARLGVPGSPPPPPPPVLRDHVEPAGDDPRERTPR